jgi:hypothetical protein
MVRRSIYDPLEPTQEPRWIVVRSMHGAVLESRQLPTGADLKRVFIASMLQWIDDGWTLGEFSSRTGALFCNRLNDRRMISVDAGDPHDVHTYGASHLMRYANCED